MTIADRAVLVTGADRGIGPARQRGLPVPPGYPRGRHARRDDEGQASGSLMENVRRLRIQSSVAVPIAVEGRIRSALGIGTQRTRYPPGSERLMTGFAELVATAVGNAGSHAEIRRLLDEQATWRRVATLVARRGSPAEVLGAVTEEAGQLFGADDATVTRFEPDGSSVLVVGSGARLGALPAGTRWDMHDHGVTTMVWRTGRAARLDDDRWSCRSGLVADELLGFGCRSVVAGPIVVSGRLWGAMVVSTDTEPLAPDTEERMEGFGELVAMAVGNAESRAELAVSRSRIVAASDQTRRRIERDLHDGAQQRLVSLGLELRSAESSVPSALRELREEIGRIADGLTEVLEGLREMVRGIHPAVLSEGGLGPALRMLARRSPVPVELDVGSQARFPEPVEVATYYVVSEALANAAKHARASHVSVAVREGHGAVEFSVRDDGVGGADPGRGSGLLGMRDRVESLGGSIDVRSPADDGTLIMVTLPSGPADRVRVAAEPPQAAISLDVVRVTAPL